MVDKEKAASAAEVLFFSATRKMAKAGGMALLTIEERKFLFALLIATVIPADHKILDIELSRLNTILSAKYRMAPTSLHQVGEMICGSGIKHQEFQKFAARIPDLLSIEDRCAMIGQMWDLALCDQELHADEESLILGIADAIGVPRKRVIEQQARASAQSA